MRTYTDTDSKYYSYYPISVLQDSFAFSQHKRTFLDKNHISQQEIRPLFEVDVNQMFKSAVVHSRKQTVHAGV